MQIIYKKIEELVPYEKNPRNNDDAVEYVANSIKEFGFKVPTTVINEDKPTRNKEHPTMKPLVLRCKK